MFVKAVIGVSMLAITATASLAWAQFGDADYSGAWLESSETQKATFLADYAREARRRAQPSSADHPSTARYKINYLECLDSGKVDLAAVSKTMTQSYGADRFKCVTPEIMASVAIGFVCRPYLTKDPEYMLPPLPAPCQPASP